MVSNWIMALSLLDVLPMDMIYSWFNLEFDDITDEPINSYFEMAGFERQNAIKNIGSTSIFLLCYILIILISMLFYSFGF